MADGFEISEEKKPWSCAGYAAFADPALPLHVDCGGCLIPLPVGMEDIGDSHGFFPVGKYSDF